MFCRGCGKEASASDAFCRGCGRPLSDTKPVQSITYRAPTSPSLGKIAAIVFGVLFVVAIITIAVVNEKSASVPASEKSMQPAMIPAKYDEAQAVIKLCGKPTQDHPQDLHVGAASEGRSLVYRKYNTELWFYRGPESAQWMLMNALVANGDASLSVEEANKRLPCMHGDLQDHMRAPKNEEERVAVERAKTVAENTENAQKASDEAAAARKASDDSDLSTRAAIGAASLKAAARNPDSLKLDKVLGMDDGTICYEYRAQNGFGGMNREMATLPPNAKSLTTSDAIWNKYCAHKHGLDVKDNAEKLMELFH